MSNSKASISLTPEQIISLVGHGVTPEQLNATRRELSDQIERNRVELSGKVDSKFNMILGALLANIAGTIGFAFWIGSKVG